MLLQGNLRWAPLLPPSPTTPQKGNAETPSSSSGPASKEATTTKQNREKGKTVDGGGEQDGDVAGGKSGGKGDDDEDGFEFSWAGVEDLAKTHDLCATGPAFELALGTGDPEIGRYSSRLGLKHQSAAPIPYPDPGVELTSSQFLVSAGGIDLREI